MSTQQTTSVEKRDGRFVVLGLISIALPGPWLWHVGELSHMGGGGAIFRCFDGRLSGDAHYNRVGGINDQERAYLLVTDVSKDPDEPDISTFDETNLKDFDAFLQSGIRHQMADEGRQLTKWMSSHFAESSGMKALTTAYIALDQGRQRQYIDVRTYHLGRKLVIGGCFDVDFANELAVPIVSAMRGAQFLQEVSIDTAPGRPQPH